MFTKEALKNRSTSLSYARGVGYYKAGYVTYMKIDALDIHTYNIQSRVLGTETYDVNMNIDTESNIIINASCTCSYNFGGICKHIVATGLKFIEEYQKDALEEQNHILHIDRIIKDFEHIDENRKSSAINREKIILQIITTSISNNLVLYMPEGLDVSDTASLPWRYTSLYSYLAKCSKHTDNGFILNSLILDRVLDLLASFDNIYAEDGQTPIVFANDAFNLHLDVNQVENGDITITLQPMPIMFFGKTRAYVMEGNTIMRLPHGIPLSFYKALVESKGNIVIPATYAIDFLEKMLPRLKQELHTNIIGISEIKRMQIPAEVHLYVQRGEEESSIKLTAFLQYDRYIRQNVLDYKNFVQSDNYYKLEEDGNILFIYRNFGLEASVRSKLINTLWYGINPEGNYLLFTGSDRIYLFIKDFSKIIEPTWIVHYENGLEGLKIEKKKITVNFDFSLSDDRNFFEFDLDFHCRELHITPQQLEQYIKDRQRFIEIEGRFIEITNRKELERLFNILAKCEAVSNKKYRNRLFNFPELDKLITDNRSLKSKGDKAFNDFKEEISNGKLIEEIKLPQPYDEILRKYQKDGVNWLHFLRKYHFGGILADDMGLGKTLQTLVMLTIVKSDKPSLVICPKTLIYNWYNEVQKFAPQLKTLIIDGKAIERTQQIRSIDDHDLIITSYPVIQKDIDYFSKKEFEYCIIDEAQYIKNHKTKTAKTVKTIRARHRLALTGTPIENNLMELWSIFDFLMPGFLGSNDNFKQQYDTPIGRDNNKEILESLRNRIRPFILRRTKQEMLEELPPKIEQVSYAHLSAEQLTLYAKVLEEVRANIFSTIEQKGFENSHIEILAALTRLRQICNHPALLAPNLASYRKLSSGKVEQFDELLEEAIYGGHKMLVFSQFTRMLGILAQHLENKGIAYCYLDGQTENRQQIIDNFNNDPNIMVFLISIKAGGYGLNLTSADTVIIFDPWWNPMVEMQATDRAYRIGQTRPVNIYKLITHGTIEEKILKLQERKKILFDDIVKQNDEFIKKLTWDDIREIFA